MSSASGSVYVHVALHDGSELFGVRAFPFRRDRLDAVAFDVPDGRRMLTEQDGTLTLLDPETNDCLPSQALWLQANDDPVLRSAIKERCGL